MVRKKGKRLLTGILCASMILSEAMCMDIHSYAAEGQREPESKIVEAEGQGEPESKIVENEEPELETVEAETGNTETVTEMETETEAAKTSADQDPTAEDADMDTSTETSTDIGIETGMDAETETTTETGTEAVAAPEKGSLSIGAGQVETEAALEPVNDGSGTGTIVPGISDDDLLALEPEARLETMKTADTTIEGSGISNNIVWTLNSVGELIIVGTGEYETWEITYSDDTSQKIQATPWFWYESHHGAKAKTAKVLIKNIENPSYMFAACKELESVDLSGLDMGSVKNMSHMFFGCSNLEALDLSWMDTSMVEDMSYLFARCQKLTDLKLSGPNAKFSTKNVTDMSSMFYHCRELISVDIGSFDTGKVTNMNAMFALCYRLTKLDLNHFVTDHVTDMGSMFCACPSLTSLEISNFNTSKVTDMSMMFHQCMALTVLDVSHFDTGNVTTMHNMFGAGYLNDIQNLDVSHFDTSKVTDMSYMFFGCFELNALDVSNFDTSSVTNMSNMFTECRKVPNLDVSGFDTGNVTRMDHMFYDCESLTGVDVSHFDTSKVTDMSYMFAICTSLRSLILTSFDTGKVTNIGHMFHGCENLAVLDLSSFDLSYADSLDYSDKSIGFITECSGLQAIFTPRHLKADVPAALPADESGLDWYDKEGSTYTELPDTKAESILIMRGRQAPVTADSIVVQKVKKEYVCGERLDISDLTVIYFDSNKNPAIVSEFTTNADEIDMSAIGKKTLTVTYKVNGVTLTGDVELEVQKAAQPLNSSNVTVTFPNKTAFDYSYNGKPKEPDITVEYKGNDSETVFLVKGTDYTVTYHNNVDAYEETLTRVLTEAPTAVIEGMGEYSGTVSVPFTIDKAAAPDGETLEAYVEQCETAKDGQTLDLSGCFESCGEKTGYEIIEVQEDDTVSGNVFSKVPVTEDIDEKGILTYSTNAGEGNDFAVIKIKVSFRNYKDGELTAKVVFSGKEPVQITGISMPDSVYNKKAVSYRGTAKVLSKDGEELTGEVTLTYSYHGTQADGTVYHVSENAPVHAGDYVLTVAVAEDNEIYSGSEAYPFQIKKASVVITAKNVVLEVGEQAPASYAYDIRGLLNGDTLKRQPYFSLRDANGNILGKPDTGKAGNYAIVPSNADAGTDYAIRYQEGVLTVKRSGIGPVIRDIKPQIYTGSALKPALQVYGDDGETLLKEGQDFTVIYKQNKDASTLDTNGKPFEGGYKVTELCSEQSPKPSSAQSSGQSSNQNGSTEKVIVDAGFDENLPYVIVKGKGNFNGTIYKNFVILRADISGQNGSLADGFSMKYTEQAVKNANKTQAVFGSLKYKKAMKLGTDYTVSLKAGSDVQYGGNSGLADGEIPSMWSAETEKKGKGYSAPAIPKGYYGSFTMTVSGMGNYMGTVTKTIVIAEDAGHLMQKATVTLGASQKKVTGNTKEQLHKGITLQPGYYDTKERQYYPVLDDDGNLGTTPEDKKNVFTVKLGNTYLIYGRDYTVEYSGNNAIGTASMTVVGKGGYAGSKKVTFQIAGEAFNEKTVRVKAYDENGTDGNGFRTRMMYTGKAVTQDNVLLTNKKEPGSQDYKEFVFGEDYTVSYKNNQNKGTATMIFTANPESGYSGSFKKTFQIESVELADIVRSQNEGRGVTVVRNTAADEGKTGSIKSMSLTEAVPYTKGGVKPSAQEKVALIRADNRYSLIEGKDYTVSYQYNKTVTTNGTEKKPLMVIKGKGNYKGTLKIAFTISKAELTEFVEDAVFTAVQYQKNRRADYEYKPAIKLTDGKKVLKAGRDYHVEYRYNTQAELSRCFDSETGTVSGMTKAVAIITVPKNSNYQISGASAKTGIVIPLGDYIYKEKLVNNKNLYVVTSPATYTGGQVKTELRVYYGAQEDIKRAKRANERNNAKLTGAGEGCYQLKCLVKDKDYTLVWGTNKAAGKNKGSVKIIGKGMKYGGSVNVKFTIEKKSVYMK